MGIFTVFDMIVFVGLLLAVMALGLWAGRKEETSEDYFLAGKTTRWWGVTGSIFGSNVSANHIVGMMGVGFTLGFVESQFEITAVAGLMLLCYGFLPVYRRLNLYTLSEYLGRRYNDACRCIYAVVMIYFIIVVQLVPGFYVGSRAMNILLLDEAASMGQAVEGMKAVQIDYTAYVIGIFIMAIVTGIYTIAGGLKAVIVTDVLQSIMMIVAAVIVAFLTFSTVEIGGWGGLRALDAGASGADKIHLYLPMDHPARPWTGMLTGLMILHFNYWGANQFIVQRVLSARSDKEARIGIITAGFLKLTIPFLSIGTGVAAFYLFTQRMPGQTFDGDTAFPMLMRQVVVPVGAGLVGLVAAGLVGAILSSIDSLLNSGATILTFDLYKRYIRPQATEKELILVGRICIVVFVLGAALLTTVVMDPNRSEHFYTYVAGQTAKLVTGIVVAFALGMFWGRATGAGGLAAIISGIIFSYGLPAIYNNYLGTNPEIASLFGTKLNFFHGAALAAVFAGSVHVIVSLMTQPDEERSNYTWTKLGGHDPTVLGKTVRWLLITLAIYAVLAVVMVKGSLDPSLAGLLAGLWTLTLFGMSAWKAVQKSETESKLGSFLGEDRLWAGLLCSIAVFMMFHYY